MAKLNCPKCPDFDAMCTSQPLSKVASYEWCRKYLEGLEEVNGTITLSTDLFLRLLRKAYSDAYYGAIHMEFMRDIKDVEYLVFRNCSIIQDLLLLIQSMCLKLKGKIYNEYRRKSNKHC